MTKRLTALILTILFALTLGLTCAAEEDEFTGLTNIVQNGDFEYFVPDNTTGVLLPGGWDADPSKVWTKDGARAKITTEEACSGTRSARLDSMGVNFALFAQYIEKAERRTNYVVRAKIKIAGGTGSFQFKFECSKGGTYYGDPNGTFAGQNYTKSISSTNNEWMEYVSDGYITSDDLDSFVLIAVSRGLLVYIDDVELYAVGGPGRFVLEDYKGVYYTGEETEGSASIKLAPEYEFDDTKTVFELKNEADETVQTKEVTGSRDTSFRYALSAIKPGEVFHVQATMYDTVSGKVLQKTRRPVSVQNRPTDINHDGQWIVDGKPFSPVYAMGVSSNVEALKRMKEIGVNTVACGAGWLDACQELGLHAIVFLYGGMHIAASDENLEGTIQTVKKYKDHPALAAWAVMDEPFGVSDADTNDVTHELLMKSYDVIREIDPATPVSIVEAALFPASTYAAAKYCDVFSNDPYPANMHDPATFISEFTHYAMDAVHFQKPVFTTVQTFLWSGNWWPSHDAYRSSLYQSYFEGAIGVAYYCIEKSYNDKALYDTDLWQGLVDFSRNEYELCAEHFSRKETPPFNDSRTGDVWYHSFVKNNKIYMIALNRSKGSEKTFDIPLVSYDGSISVNNFYMHVVAGSKEADRSISGNTLTAVVPANGVVVYELSPTGAFNASSLSWAGYNKITDYYAPHFVNASTYFDDMNDHTWAASQVDSLYTAGVLHEEGKFYPAENVTRAEFGSYIVKALKLSGTASESFRDIDPDAYYARQIALGKENGIFTGDENGNFNPKEPITRQDVMVIINRAKKLANGSVAADKFTDWELVSDYAKDSVCACIASKIIKGNGDGTVNPKGFTTKAEAAVIVYRIMNYKAAADNKEETVKEEEKEEELQFKDIPDEYTLKRWNDAAKFLSGVGLGTINVEKSITKGAFEKLIENLIGVPYDVFPDKKKALTFDDATEALVKLLGYEPYAERDGYNTEAVSIGLLKGVKSGDPLRAGEAAVMLQNALDIKLLKPTGFGEGASQSFKKSDETLLSEYRDIKKYEGTVADNYTTATDLKKSQIRIGETVFQGGISYIGQKVTVYAEGEDKIIRYIRPSNSVRIFTVNEEDIEKNKTTKTTFVYRNENGKTVSVAISGAKLIYNGSYKAPWTSEDIIDGTVTFIANDGSNADVIMVEKTQTHIIDSVDSTTNTLYFKDGTKLEVDLTSRKFTLVSDKGEELTALSSCEKDNVLSVALGTNNTKLILSKKAVTGRVTETDSDSVVIGSDEFKIESALAAPSVGSEYRFLIDYKGKIVAYDKHISDSRYGYLTAIGETHGISKAPQLKIFTDEGKMQVFDVAEHVSIDDTRTVSKDKLLTSEGINAAFVPQLIMYSVNAQNLVTKLYFAKDGAQMDRDEKAQVFSCDLESYDQTGVGYVPERMKYLNAQYVIADDTPIFVIPGDISADKDYKICSRDDIFNATGTYKNFSLYDCDEAVVSAIVYKNEAEATFSADSYSGALYLVFDGCGKGVNGDGEDVNLIYGYNEMGKYVSVPLTEDCEILFGNRTITNMAAEPDSLKDGNNLKNSIEPESLNRGDMLVCLKNSKGEVRLGRVLIRAKAPVMMEDAYDWRPSAGGNYSHLTFAHGQVNECVPLGILMNVKTFRSPTAVHERLYHNMMGSSGVPACYLYDRAADTIKKISISDIHKGDEISVIRTLTSTRIFMIYR